MSLGFKNQSIIQDNGSFLITKLFERLKPEKWPFQFNDLPKGTLLVGGAIRDGLLYENISFPEMDFVVPQQATNVCRSLVEKYGGTLVELDSERDIGRYVINDWKIDIASRIGENLKEDLLYIRKNNICAGIALNPFTDETIDEKKINFNELIFNLGNN